MPNSAPDDAGGDLRCLVLTPVRTVFDQFVDSVKVAAPGGVLEIFARFEPTISPLSVGVLKVRRRDGTEIDLAVHGGYLDMNGGLLLILADSAELGGEIDVERARRSLARSKALLAKVTSDKSVGVDVDRARLALFRALTRLRLAGESME